MQQEPKHNRVHWPISISRRAQPKKNPVPIEILLDFMDSCVRRMHRASSVEPHAEDSQDARIGPCSQILYVGQLTSYIPAVVERKTKMEIGMHPLSDLLLRSPPEIRRGLRLEVIAYESKVSIDWGITHLSL